MKFYECETCGKIIAVIKDTDVKTECCGHEMRRLVPGTTDGAMEKHVPMTTTDGRNVSVKVGSLEHPMTAAHHIEWISVETTNGHHCRTLRPGNKPEATFALVPYEKVKNVYEYCNLHGLWIS